jgi:hypothetical protein
LRFLLAGSIFFSLPLGHRNFSIREGGNFFFFSFFFSFNFALLLFVSPRALTLLNMQNLLYFFSFLSWTSDRQKKGEKGFEKTGTKVENEKGKQNYSLEKDEKSGKFLLG